MPQIELMQSDLPHTLYLDSKRKADEGTVLTDDVLKKQIDANRRARARREKKVSLDELFEKKTDNQ